MEYWIIAAIVTSDQAKRIEELNLIENGENLIAHHFESVDAAQIQMDRCLQLVEVAVRVDQES